MSTPRYERNFERKFGLIFVLKAVPRLRWFSLSTWRPGFEASQFVWGFLGSRVAVWQVLVIILRFPHSASFHHSCIHLNKRTCLETIKQYGVLSDIWELQSENYSNVLFFPACTAHGNIISDPLVKYFLKQYDRDVGKDRKYMFALLHDITIKVPVPVSARSQA